MQAAAIPARTFRAMKRTTPVLNLLSANARARAALPDAGALSPGGTYRVTASALWLRSGPSTSATQIALMPNGALVTAGGGSENGFAEVTFNGKSGWASEQYLAAASGSGAVPGPTLGAGDYYVKTQQGTGVNLRAMPSTTANILQTLPDGAKVHAVGANTNGFVQVDSPQLGWIATQYLQTQMLTVVSAAAPTGLGDQLDTETLQVRTMLAAWASFTGLSDFGQPADFLPTPEAQQREAEALTKFQDSQGLEVTGQRNDETIARLRAFASEIQTAKAPTVPITSLPVSKPTQQGPTPTPPLTVTDQTKKTATAAGVGIVAVLLIIGAFLLGGKSK